MNIAIDLDGTIDKLGVTLCRIIVLVLKLAGWRAFLVTKRDDSDKLLAKDWAEAVGIDRAAVVCTNGCEKRWACEQRGLKIDLWLGNDPS